MVDLILQIVAAIVLVIIAISLTAAYWRRAIKKVKALAKEKLEWQKALHEADVEGRLEEQRQSVHIDRMKDRVALEKQAQIMSCKLDFYYKVLTEVQHELHRQMDERADYIREMVDSTLKIMYYEDMKQIERMDHVAVNNFCRDVFEGCKRYLDGNVDLRLETHLEDDETMTINMRLLQRILTNLLRCSMQFTHEGEIVLKVEHHSQKQENYLSFAVSDTGMGIPNDVKDNAFEKLGNTDISIKIVVVRLRLCRALVRLLGGIIYIDPHRKKGTSIVFTIKI